MTAHPTRSVAILCQRQVESDSLLVLDHQAMRKDGGKRTHREPAPDRLRATFRDRVRDKNFRLSCVCRPLHHFLPHTFSQLALPSPSKDLQQMIGRLVLFVRCRSVHFCSPFHRRCRHGEKHICEDSILTVAGERERGTRQRYFHSVRRYLMRSKSRSSCGTFDASINTPGRTTELTTRNWSIEWR